MRLLRASDEGVLTLTDDIHDNFPPYAILSHTWGADNEEVTFADLQNSLTRDKPGYAKLTFCRDQAKRDGIDYFWVDTCCIDKANHAELSEAITSMYRWYRDAVKCYVYLSDVSLYHTYDSDKGRSTWEVDFRKSRWFTRGWTLQELLAPKCVEFYSKEQELLGNKMMLIQQIHDITTIPISALQGTSLTQFSVAERMRWTTKRKTKRAEDQAYCLLGIFEIFMPLIYGEREHAFVRLQDEIQKRSGTSSSAEATENHWLVPRTSNPLFTGREDLLQELHTIVHKAVINPVNGTQCRIVISGLGGQGKSELCLQLARRVRHMFWGVFWIDVTTTDVAEQSFQDIARSISAPVSTFEDAQRYISSLKRPWFLVLDNADDPDIHYQKYFPDGSMGVVILTSRNDECHQYATAKAISLQGLQGIDAQQLLLKAARVPQDQRLLQERDAQTVASLLQSHPLALVQAGAYVSRGHCTLADYPRIYTQQRQRLLAYRPQQAQSRYQDVYTTFEVSANTLHAADTEVARDALQLLPLLAVCASNRLPLYLFKAAWKGARYVSSDTKEHEKDERVELLTPWHVARVHWFCDLSKDHWDSFRIVEAANLLKAFSLISLDTTDGDLYISTHALVHAWARDRQNDREQHQTWLQMGCMMALIGWTTDRTRKAARPLQPHVEAALDWEIAKMFATEPPVMVARVLVNCGRFLESWSADVKLSLLVQRTFAYLQLNPTKVDRSWSGLYHLAANNLRRCGKIQDAITILEGLVELNKSMSDDNNVRLTSQYDLAKAYRGNGQVKESIMLLEQVVNIEKRLLAEEHPDRLASQQELATAYLADGQVEDAIALLQVIVETGKRSMAPDHPSYLTSQHELARAYRKNGQLDKAILLLEDGVRVRKQSLAEDHPNGLMLQHELARAYQASGKLKEAVPLLHEVMEIQKQSLTDEHPNRLLVQHNLSTILWALGEHQEAFDIMKRVVETKRRVFAPGDRILQKSEDWLAYYERKMGMEPETPERTSAAPVQPRRTKTKEERSKMIGKHESRMKSLLRSFKSAF